MNLRVKMFYDNCYDVEEGINKWLEENDVEVIDIKYSCALQSDCFNRPGAFNTKFSAMIIYKLK